MPSTLLDAKSADLERFQDALDAAFGRGHAEYDALFDAPPTGLSVHEIDLDKVLVRVSRAHQLLLGYSPEHMVGKPASTFIVLQETAERAMNQKLSGTRQLKPFVRAFRKADGKPATMLLLDRYLTDASGQVTGIRTVLTEIPPEVLIGL